MKKKTFLSIAIVCLIQADSMSATVTPKHRGRGLRKDPKKAEKKEKFNEVCINLGRKGEQTFVVPETKVDWFSMTIRRSRGAKQGICRQSRTKELNKRQRKVQSFCCHFGPGDDCTLYAPRAVRKWLTRRRCSRGECENETGPDVEMKLRQVGEDGHEILGYEWVASEIFFESAGEMKETIESHPISLHFESRERVHGKASCNNCFGNIAKLTDTQLRIDWLATTKKLCHPQEVMQQEHAFVWLMSNRTFSYKVIEGGDVLLLYELLKQNGEELKGDLMARFTRVR